MSYENIINEIDFDRYGKIEGVTTRKQALMMDKIIEGEPPTKAALEAGFGCGKARTPWKLIDSAELRRRFQEVAEKRGLTVDRIAMKIEEHLEARQNQTLNGKEVTVSEAPDNRVQQKAIEQLTELMGMRDASKVVQGGSSVTLSISGPAADRLAAMLGGE